MNLYDVAVNERVFKVGVTAHGLEKTLEYACFGPATVMPELAIPVELGCRPLAREVSDDFVFLAVDRACL